MVNLHIFFSYKIVSTIVFRMTIVFLLTRVATVAPRMYERLPLDIILGGTTMRNFAILFVFLPLNVTLYNSTECQSFEKKNR